MRRKAEPEERTLPHSLEAERSVLGAILIRNDALEAVSASLTPPQFYREAHRLIFAAMVALAGRRTKIDFVTLKDELAQRGRLDEVGGAAYIASLADGVPRSTNVQAYMNIVAEKAGLRDIIYAGNAMVAAAYEGAEEAQAILTTADRALLALHGRNGAKPQALADTAATRFQMLEWRVDHKGELRGLDTGYASINALTLGLRAGDLDIIAARPSIGKSALSLNMAVHAARKGHRAAVFSLEMTREQLEDRILSQLSKVALSRIQSGHIGEAEWAPLAQAIEEMGSLPMVIDDRAGLTAVEIRATCRRVLAEYGDLALVVVDYIQLIASALQRKGATRTEELSDAAMRLKDLAKELGAPVLLLSQLRRVEGRPRLEDLRECGTLEQAADVVGLLYRKDHRVSGPTECNLAKQRNGPTGSVLLHFDGDTTTFTDAPEETCLPEPTPEEQATTTRRRRARTFAQRAMAGG